MAKREKRPGEGAPRKYNRIEVLNRVLEEMSKGDRCLEAILESSEEFPSVNSYWAWLAEDTEESKELLKIGLRAQELWCRAQQRKMIEIADDQSRDIMEVEESYTTKSGELKTYIRKTSDNTAVNRDRLRIQARQWAMAKLAPKIFGDKITQEITGKDGGAITYERLVDKPPAETPEQWQERVSAQLADRQKNLTH